MSTSPSGAEVPDHSPRVDVMDRPNITGAKLTVFFDMTNGDGEDHAYGAKNVAAKVVVGVVMVALVLGALLGNLLVCAAIFCDRSLRHRKANLFLVSLALADILVAVIVMPFAIVNTLSERWTLGEDWCILWIAFDVMCATASILHLCLVCVDRYLQIHFPLHYQRDMSRVKISMLIACAWATSFLVSFVPILSHWHVSELAHAEASTCLFRINLTYAVLSSSVSFYIPCIVMMTLYIRLFQLATEHASRLYKCSRRPSGGSVREKVPRRRMNVKAAITLGVMMGVFLICWLPFFIISPIAAYCAPCISENAFQVFTWLGYSNSCANPIIYSLFNLKFRQAFYRQLHLRFCGRTETF